MRPATAATRARSRGSIAMVAGRPKRVWTGGARAAFGCFSGDRCRGGEGAHQLPRTPQIGAALQLLGDLLRRLEPLRIPGVEFAQVALGALAAEVLLGAVDHPEPLGDHLLAARRRCAPTGQ